MRKYHAVTALLLAMLLPGCNEIGSPAPPRAPGPGDVARSYLQAKMTGQMDKAYVLLSAKDRKRISMANYRQTQMQGENPLLVSLLAPTITVLTKSVTQKADTATAKMVVTIPKKVQVVGQIIDSAEAGRLPLDARVLQDRYDAARAGGGAEVITLPSEVQLVREESQWRVSESHSSELGEAAHHPAPSAR